MMVVFFVGIGLSAIAASLATTPLQIGVGLFVIGMFAAIYHPVGLAIVSMTWRNMGVRIAANGVWGNLGVASAALITGYMIDNGGWRMAFIVPGTFSIATGLAYLALRWDAIQVERINAKIVSQEPQTVPSVSHRSLLLRVSGIVFLTTAVSSIIFQSTTFALPKIFDERLQGLASQLSTLTGRLNETGQGDIATIVGSMAFIVFAVASIAQIIVGSMLDRFGPRRVFMAVAILQLMFFSLMPGLSDGIAFFVALGFMLGAFGQIPINDFMIGKMASGTYRARIYGIRYVVAFSVLAMSLPLIAFVYEHWGFDMLFRILAGAALLILCAVMALPQRLPVPEGASVGTK